MFDCGGEASSALQRCRVNTAEIEHIFISHAHPDHCSGIPLFIQMEHLKKREEPLDIHMPSELVKLMNDIFAGMYLFPEKLGFPVKIDAIDDEFAFKDANIEVTVVRNPHLEGNAEVISSGGYSNRMQCYSFVIESEIKKIVYSADITGTDDIAGILDDTDLLVIEGMHIDLEDLPILLMEKNVSECLLTHLPDEFDTDAVSNLFRKKGYVNLSFAAEGMVVFL